MHDGTTKVITKSLELLVIYSLHAAKEVFVPLSTQDTINEEGIHEF